MIDIAHDDVSGGCEKPHMRNEYMLFAAVETDKGLSVSLPFFTRIFVEGGNAL